MKKYFVLAAALLLATVTLYAQADRGVIRGTVSDSTGAVIPGATVTATRTSTNTKFNTTSTATGDYTIPSLQAGEYKVEIESTGFKTYVRNSVVIIAGGTARVDATLDYTLSLHDALPI